MKGFHLFRPAFWVLLGTILLAGPTVPFLPGPGTASAAWEPDMRLTYNDSTDILGGVTALAVGPGGALHAVFYSDRTGWPAYQIYCKNSTDRGVTWSPDVRLSFDSNWNDYPSVAAAGSCVYVAWAYQQWNVYYVRSTDQGQTWSSEDSFPGGVSAEGAVSLWASGSNVHLVWSDQRQGFGDIEIYYRRSTDQGATWLPEVLLSNHSPDTAYALYPMITGSGSNVYLLWGDDHGRGIYCTELHFRRSTNQGATWGPETRLTFSPPLAAAYNSRLSASGSSLHLVWDRYLSGVPQLHYMQSTDGGTTWSPDTCLVSLERNGGEPSVAASGSNVHVSWDDYRDTHDGRWPQVYYKSSTNGGASWSPDARLTNGPPSGGTTLALGDTMVHLIWYDIRDGNWEIYYKRNPNGNSSGVEVSEGTLGRGLQLPLSVIPNPFVSFARVPGHERERFALYDVSGRKVGTYNGSRIGEGLRAGVYFLKPEGKDAKPVRIVKVK